MNKRMPVLGAQCRLAAQDPGLRAIACAMARLLEKLDTPMTFTEADLAAFEGRAVLVSRTNGKVTIELPRPIGRGKPRPAEAL